MQTSDTQVFWAAASSDFRCFLEVAFAEIYPGKDFEPNWHIDAIVQRLNQAVSGKMPRQIINLPPRHLKSFIVSVAWPAFILGKDPSAKLICVSYSDELTQMFSRDCKRLIESQWYLRLFPNVRVIKSTASEIITSDGGGRYATSVGGTLTGRGADFIIVDDPIKAADVFSESARKKNNEWFNTTLLSRLDDKLRSVLVIVMQRLHVNDLTGYVQNTGGFQTMSFPAIALKDEDIPTGPNAIYHRNKGQALCEALESLEILGTIRDQLGPQTFSAQYQQSPDAPEGALFKAKYLKYVEKLDAPAGGLYWVSIDSALSVSETADYSAITIGYSVSGMHYVLRAERGRWDYETLLQKSLALAAKYSKCTFIVEAAGSGISLIHSLRNRNVLVFHHHPKADKMHRASLVLPTFADGRVHILNQPGSNAWVSPFVNELLSFPNGRFDDQVDSVVQAINWAEPKVNSQSKIYFF